MQKYLGTQKPLFQLFLPIVYGLLAAASVIWINHTFVAVVMITITGTLLWRLWKEGMEQKDSHALYESTVSKYKRQLNQQEKASIADKKAIAELQVQLSNELAEKSQKDKIILGLESDVAENKKTVEAAESLLEEAALNAIKLHEANEKLGESRNRFERKVGQLAQKIKRCTRENAQLTIDLEDARVNLSIYKQKLEAIENAAREEHIYEKRPRGMCDLKFARLAKINLYPFPSDLQLAAQRHYNTSDLIRLNATVDFLRHQYSNYDNLCSELNTYNESARHILKCRVNAEIWANLYQ